MLKTLHDALGIPADYANTCGMPAHEECRNLVSVGDDAFGRPALLEAGTAVAWQSMKAAAEEEGLTLLLVSAYRSVDYQRQLIQRKLDRGLGIDVILKVNAAPGYSEHHSGRAIDIGSPDYPHLEEMFETSAAFAWLVKRAPEFGFRLSFPRNNPYGVLYEPWHWYYEGKQR